MEIPIEVDRRIKAQSRPSRLEFLACLADLEEVDLDVSPAEILREERDLR